MDYKIVLDAGHGGNDPGASGNGIIEKNITLDITKYLYDRFRELGIPVKVTRLTDETLTPTERVNRVLDAFGNSNNVIVISSHINAGGGDGAEVIYPLRNNSVLPDLILNELSKEGQNIRKSYQRRSVSDPSKDYYFMQRNTGNTQTLTVEYGFLDSTKDDVSQLKNNYRNLAEAVVRAVTSYINAPYVPIIGSDTYVVQRGDTLYSIANRFNTTVDNLKEINNLTTNALSIGQILNLPKEDTISEYTIYIVQRGDTLYSVANKNGITVDNLKEYNNLDNNTLIIGQQLLIPQSTLEEIEQYNTYIVKTGDSLYSIANRFNTTVDKIKELNNLTSNLLSVNEQLLIPTEEIIEEIPSNVVEYIVQRGDTLYNIANKYNVLIDDIRILNNLTSDILSIGQKIRIPRADINTYVVQNGDTLYSIAKRNNISVDELKNKNNLTSNLLSIGQKIII